MSDSDRDTYVTSVTGNVSGGQIATGRHVTQTQAVVPAEVLGDDGLCELRRLLAELRADVAREATAEQRDEAVGLVDELEETLTSERPPDLKKLDYVKIWIERHLPAAAGAVTALVVHPLVGQLVKAAGDAFVGEVGARFGGA